MPVDEDVAPGSELDEDCPVEAEVWGAEPGIPALGLLELDELPAPPEEEEEEEDEDEDEDVEPDEPDEPPEVGIPEEELLLEEVAQAASASKLAATPRTATRCHCAATKVATRFMAVAPSGASAARSEILQSIHRACRASLGFPS